MVYFHKHPDVLRLAEAGAETVALYEKLKSAFISFEQRLVGQWKSQHASIASGMQATLLVQHPDSHRLVVNFDNNVVAMLSEARVMKREGVALPNSLAAALDAANKYKAFGDSTKEVIERFYQIQATVPRLIQPLLASTYERIMLAFRPGLISLTWAATNIDLYLERITTALDELAGFVGQVNLILTEQVEGSLTRLELARLFLLDGMHSLPLVDKIVLHKPRPTDFQTKPLIDSVFQGLRVLLSVINEANPSSSSTMRHLVAAFYSCFGLTF